MNSSRTVFAIALLLCLAALAWLFLGEHPLIDPGAPRTKAPPVRRMEASVPSIGAFETFNVNIENPFIPFSLRQAEKEAANRKPTTTGTRPAPEVIPPPPRVLPRVGQGLGDAPRAIGLITQKDGVQRLVVRDGGSDRMVAVGDSLGPWTLVGIDLGSVALWRDPRGRVGRYPIGDGGASATAPAARPAADGPAKPAAQQQAPAPHAKPAPSVQPQGKPPGKR